MYRLRLRFWVEKDGVVLARYGKYRAHEREPFVAAHSAKTFRDEIFPVHVLPRDAVVEQWKAIRDAISSSLGRDRLKIDYLAEVTGKFASGVHVQDIE